MIVTSHRRGWCRSLHHLHRIVVLSSTVSPTFIALLLQNLLSLCVSKAQQQLHSIILGSVVEFHQNLLGNVTVLEAMIEEAMFSLEQAMGMKNLFLLPREAHFLAHTRLLIPTDLFRNNTPWLEMTPKVLTR
jgi:hypothetical protein